MYCKQPKDKWCKSKVNAKLANQFFLHEPVKYDYAESKMFCYTKHDNLLPVKETGWRFQSLQPEQISFYFSVFPFLQKNSLGASGFHFYLKVADTSAKYKLSASTQLETHLHCRAADTESSLALIFPRGHCTVISFKNHIIQINNHRRCLLPLWSLWLLI